MGRGGEAGVRLEMEEFESFRHTFNYALCSLVVLLVAPAFPPQPHQVSRFHFTLSLTRITSKIADDCMGLFEGEVEFREDHGDKC